MKKTFYVGLLISLCACSTSNYRFQSTPSEADVEIVFKNGSRKSVGKTPLSLVPSEVNPGNEAMTLVFRKAGNETQSVHVAPSLFMKSIEVDVNFPKDVKAAGEQNTEKLLNDVAMGVADVQKFIQSKQYSVAEQKLNKMIGDNPTVAVFYSLMGNVHYLDKRLDSALTYYRKSLDLNPSSAETTRMVQKIESLKTGGVR